MQHEKLSIVREDEDMGIGFYSNLYNVKEYTIKNPDGSTAGTIRITKSAKKKPKRLQYNFKYVSSKILSSKTSDSASKALTTARVNLSTLYRKLNTGKFDDDEIKLAIIHAKKMERIAQKKLKNLKTEENARQHACRDKIDENDILDSENSENEQIPEIKEEDIEKLMKDLQNLMEETMEQTTDELVEGMYSDMDEDDLELLKKKHRAKELQEITNADMKYLKALFHKLQREKEEAGKGNDTAGSEGVSLELSGFEMPLQEVTPPVLPEGGSIDLSI